MTRASSRDDEGARSVRLVELTKRFGDVVAVDRLDLDIAAGSFFALLGPSGCGKTTTLRMIAGLEEPTEGRVLLGDENVTPRRPHQRPVNTVFQSYALFPHLDVAENVAFGLRRRGLRGAEVARQVADALALVQLSGMERRKPAQLSGGQQQRVALARALVNHPTVLLLDEPLGALDLRLRKQMQIELKRIQTEVGITFIHVTHDQEEAMTMADTIAVMNEGRVEQLGSPESLYERPATAFVANFLGVSNLLDASVEGRDDAHATVVTHGTKLRVERDAADAHARIQVGVRPEKMRLTPAGAFDEHSAADENELEGMVVDRSYAGVTTQYLVRLPWDDELTVITQNVGYASAVELGSSVTVRWPIEHTFVVPA